MSYLPRGARRPGDARLIAALLAVYVIWGSTYLAMRIAVHDLPPLLMAGLRFVCAGGLVLGYARHRGAPWPSTRDWLRVAPAGACFFVGGSGLVATAEQSVSSGGAAVVCATMPLWVGVLGIFLGERPTAREWLSLVLGFAGVVVLLGGPSLTGKPAHIAMVIASPIAWAFGSILARRTHDVGGEHGPLVVPALQMLSGGFLLLAIMAASGTPLPVHAPTGAWLALAYLLGFGSLVGFTAYAWLLRNARPVVATSYAYVNPGVAVVIGALFGGESLGWSTLAANVMIVAAIVLALRRPAPAAPAEGRSVR